MTLSDRHDNDGKPRDFTVLRANPDQSRKVGNILGLIFTVLFVFVIYGWFFLAQLDIARETELSEDGLYNAVETGFLVLVALAVYYGSVLWIPGFLKYPFIFGGVVFVGWAMRGLFEEAVDVQGMHSGYWAGLRIGAATAVLVLALLGIYWLARFLLRKRE